MENYLFLRERPDISLQDIAEDFSEEEYTSHFVKPGSGKARLDNPNLCSVYPADFIADVEILARKFLTHTEWKLFHKAYLVNNKCKLDESDKYVQRRVANKLGRLFRLHGLYPVTKYFKPVDGRNPKHGRAK